jgi:hypothetical protein
MSPALARSSKAWRVLPETLFMTRSEFDGYQLFGQFILSGVLLALLYVFYLGYFGPNSVRLLSNSGAIIFLLGVILPVYIIAQMKLNYKTTIIDTRAQTITFQMFLLPISKTYPFAYFDGYVDTTVNDKYSGYKCFYLVKDDKLQYKISGRFYKNIGELEEGLSQIKYLGKIKFSSALAIQIALKKPILAAELAR